MVKIQPNYHQGMEFIQLAQLPPEDARKLSYWLPKTSRFRLSFDDIELEDCVYYKEYEVWFDSVNFNTMAAMNL